MAELDRAEFFEEVLPFYFLGFGFCSAVYPGGLIVVVAAAVRSAEGGCVRSGEEVEVAYWTDTV